MSVVCLGISAGVAWEGERGCVWVENQWHLLCYASPFSVAQSLRGFQREKKPKNDQTSFSHLECVWMPTYPCIAFPPISPLSMLLHPWIAASCCPETGWSAFYRGDII